MTATEQVTPAVAALVVGRDGADFTIGRPDLGIYVAVPEPGAVFIETLQAGGSTTAAAERASAVAGAPVDGAGFLDGLAEEGLLDAPVATAPGPARPVGGGIRWIEGVSPRVAGCMFGRAGWLLYAGAAAFCVAALVLIEDVRPSYEDWWFLGDPVLSLAILAPISIVLAAWHEAWHWLSGRALGVPAVFRVSRRGPFVVFETDLTQLVALPRRARYGPFLAGTAFDCVVLALALALRLLDQRTGLDLPPTLYRLLGAVALLQLTGIIFQAAIFLRSDGYAVLANALGCHNLYRASWLTLRARLLRLSAPDQAELAAISEHDRKVASWFCAVYLAGMLGVSWFVLTFLVPYLISMTGWLGTNLAAGSLSSAVFWESLGVMVFVLAGVVGPPLLARREQRLRRRGVLL